MSGRARGRGVARGRGAPTSAATGGAPPRRPGTAPLPSLAPITPQAQGGIAAGRASHRGGARAAEPRPGAHELPTAQLARMSLGKVAVKDTRPRRGNREVNDNEICTRPGHVADKQGISGNKIALLTNYFRIISTPEWRMYQYHVDFNPPIDSRKLRKGLLSEHSKRMFSSQLFDGMTLYSPTKLPDEVTEVFSIRQYDSAKIRVTLKRVADLPPNSPECTRVFNFMLKHTLADLGMKEVQRAYFSSENAITLKTHGLEVWPGFKTAIHQYERSCLLNIDIIHKVLRTDSVLTSMYRTVDQCGGANQRCRDMIIRELVGEIVLTRYNNKTYRIDDIDWNIHPTHTFKKKDEDITFKQYYKTAYNIDIHDDKQPMLVSRVKKKAQDEGGPDILYLIPELCTRTGLTPQMRENFRVMKDLATYTRIDPTKRAVTMRRFRSQVEGNEEVRKRHERWGVKFDNNLLQLEGRVVPMEKVILGQDKPGMTARTVPAGVQADWSNAMRGKLYTSIALHNWIIVYVDKHNDRVKVFLDLLAKVAPPLGITVSAPRRVILNNQNTSAFMDAIKANIDPSVQMVLVILPSNKKDLYDAVKKQCCVETPVPSQCVTLNVLNKPSLMSIVTKIAVQLNCKLGGEPWAVEIPLKKTMVVGIDTYHDSAKKGRSVGGFVASLNASMTRYFSQTVFQSSMQELIDGLKVCMTAALKKFYTVNNCLPERIVVFRDGVGDGQLDAVHSHEVSQLFEAFSSLGSNYQPKVAVIVVKKRINSRFFAKGQGSPDSLRNPDPGTIIDDVVTRAQSYDFFLVSQSVRQGTVTPTHYNIIHDTVQLKPDHLQRLTYKLCHLYYNWPGTIRVPAPCQYAHKLAFLTGQSLHRPPHMALADKLYYL